MAIDLFRVRFQETWGYQYGNYLEDIVTGLEVEDLLTSYARKWFPKGYTLTPYPDSPNAWLVEETSGEQQRLFFFLEPIG